MTDPSIVLTRIAVALDTPDVATAVRWARAVGPHVSVLKVGLEFYLRNGLDGVAAVREAGGDCGLFLDLKLHDIPATVAGGARSVAALQPDYLTVHASGGPAMVAAAAEALPDTRIAAVTVLTSLGDQALASLGLPSAEVLVPRWAASAVEAGAAAVVSSAQEVAALRQTLPADIHLITPGIRPVGGREDDQARVATPTRAAADGADLLVIGRPITQAEDPGGAAAAIANDLAGAGRVKRS